MKKNKYYAAMLGTLPYNPNNAEFVNKTKEEIIKQMQDYRETSTYSIYQITAKLVKTGKLTKSVKGLKNV